MSRRFVHSCGEHHRWRGLSLLGEGSGTTETLAGHAVFKTGLLVGDWLGLSGGCVLRGWGLSVVISDWLGWFLCIWACFMCSSIGCQVLLSLRASPFLLKPDKSAVAEHAIWADGEHIIQYKETTVLSSTPYYHARLQREAIEIYKHPNNFNRKGEALKLNKTWHPILEHIKQVQIQRNRPDRKSVV